MNKLNKLLLRTFFPPFILTFFIALFVLLMQFLWKYVDDMIGKGLEWYIVAELLFYASASMVPLALPLAMLLSSIMTLGNLGENHELVAIKSSGISLLKSLRILFVITIIISLLAFTFANYYLPYANLKFGTLLYDIRQKRPAINIKEGIFYNEIEGYSIKIGKKDNDNKTIHDIIIYDHTSGMGNDNITLSDKGEMYTTEDDQFLIIKLLNGKQYQEIHSQNPIKKTYEHIQVNFDKWEKILDLSSFNLTRINEDFFKDHYEMLNITQLSNAQDTIRKKMTNRISTLEQQIKTFFYFKRTDIDSTTTVSKNNKADNISINPGLNYPSQKVVFNNTKNLVKSIKDLVTFAQRDYSIQEKLLNRHQIEWHRKFTLSVACFILFLIGAPLGSIIRKGGLGWPLVFATLFFICYHILSITGEKFAREGILPVYMGMWLSTFILLPIGLILMFYANQGIGIFKKSILIDKVKLLSKKNK